MTWGDSQLKFAFPGGMLPGFVARLLFPKVIHKFLQFRILDGGVIFSHCISYSSTRATVICGITIVMWTVVPCCLRLVI